MESIIDNSHDLVVFDFDGTIIPQNSFNLFIKYIYINKLSLKRIYLLLSSSILRKLRLISSLEFKNKVLQIIKNMPKEELRQLFDEFSKSLHPLIRGDAIKKINFHKFTGAKIIIISGALYDYLAPLQTRLSVDKIIATRIEYKEGRCMGGIEGVELLGIEKVKSLRKYIQANGLSIKKIYCYTDSISDLPILHESDVRVLVNSNKNADKDKNIIHESWE